jgi:hypothetical protein
LGDMSCDPTELGTQNLSNNIIVSLQTYVLLDTF